MQEELSNSTNLATRKASEMEASGSALAHSTESSGKLNNRDASGWKYIIIDPSFQDKHK